MFAVVTDSQKFVQYVRIYTMVITYCGDSDFNQSCIIMVNICQVYVIYKDGIVVRGAFVAYVTSDQHYLSPHSLQDGGLCIPVLPISRNITLYACAKNK